MDWELDVIRHHGLARKEGADIEALRLELLDRHPKLLAGLAETADENPVG